jgi:hypothetical protein
MSHEETMVCHWLIDSNSSALSFIFMINVVFKKAIVLFIFLAKKQT